MKNKVLPIILLVILVMAVTLVSAQILPPPPPPPGGGGGVPGSPQTPIDGGIFLLIASGLAYGAKKLYK